MDRAAVKQSGGLGLSPGKPRRLRSLYRLLGVGEQHIVPDDDRRKSTLVFTLIGTLTLLGFGLFNLSRNGEERLQLLGLIQVLEVCLLLLPTLWLSSRGRQPLWSETMLVLSGFVIFASNTVLGGQVGDAPYWSFVYPYLVFFLCGQKLGWAVGLGYVLCVPALMFYSAGHWHAWVYAPAECFYYGVAYLFNVVTAAHFNLLRSSFQQQLWSEVEFHTAEVRRHVDILRFNGSHDPATGLLNRQGLSDALQDEMLARRARGGFLLVLCLRFFRVPELAGVVGLDKVDASLAALAQRLRQHLPNALQIGRLGDDKLALVLYSPRAGVQAVAAVHDIRSLPGGSERGEFSIHEEFAFGVAVHHCTASEAASELLRKSEQAMLYACDNGLPSQFYDAALNAHFVLRNTGYEKLREAILGENLSLHYQPQLDLRSGRVVGAEALARWMDPEEGMVPPASFIPIIESTGLLQRFTVWTVERAVRDCAAWQATLPGVSVAINFSADALHDPQVLHALEQALERWQLRPALVVIELTESVLLKSPQDSLSKMAHLVALGARLSIDDYGAGFSSLTYLKQLPAHEMKIDKSFVTQLSSSAQDLAIVKSSIELGHDLGLQVLAEGIEDAAALDLLQRAGCDLGQGWHFARALPLADFVQWAQPRLG